MVNSSFSTECPSLQIAWDSTSIGLLKECPRKYYLSMLANAGAGYAPRHESVHLIFGLHYHAALEQYDHERAAGKDHQSATIAAVRRALVDTWDPVLQRPWLSDDGNKNRYTLIRSVVWYLEQFADDTVKTTILANGKAAVELSFRFESDYTSFTGEKFWLCGHLDRMGEFHGQQYILDRKTSKNTIGQDFFQKYSPDNQFTLYSFAAKVVYALPTVGLIVDAAQIAVTFTRFQRGIVQRTPEQLEEWYKDLGFWLGIAQHCAKSGDWPMNDKSCGLYGGCPFRDICGKSPSVREQWLKAGFHTRVWDPLKVRGDV